MRPGRTSPMSLMTPTIADGGATAADLRRGDAARPGAAGPRPKAGPVLRIWYLDYSMRRPEMAREITSCWICSVPSKMS
jgi:hypothetical protein